MERIENNVNPRGIDPILWIATPIRATANNVTAQNEIA
jgi:hypothetical protein